MTEHPCISCGEERPDQSVGSQCPHCGHVEPPFDEEDEPATVTHFFVVEVTGHKVRWTCPCGEVGPWWKIQAAIILMENWLDDHIGGLS